MRSIRWAMAAGAVLMTMIAPQVARAQRPAPRLDAEARAELAAQRAQLAAQRPRLDAVRLELAAQRPAVALARVEMEAQRPYLAAIGPELDLVRQELAAVRPRLSALGPQLSAAGGGIGRAYAVGVGTGVDQAGDEQATPPEAWLQEDPAGPLYQSAREALNRRRYDEAAEMFGQIREDYPRSGYVADSYYWQAFALQREGGQRNLRQAAELLRTQADRHPQASTRGDARSLMVRIEAQLARRGDADAAEAIARQASGPCGEDQDARLAALSALMNMNASQAVPILQEVLRSRGECSVELRRRAVFLIAQHMTDESVDILLDLAHRNPDPDREVREQAVFWLHQVDTPEALEALESILRESDDEEIQERAIFAISQRSDARSAEVLRDYAERSDVPTELRENAIFWIGQNSSAGGARYLMDLYDRLDNDELRERAIFGVAQTSSEEGRQWLLGLARNRNESIDVRKNALFWAGQMGGLQPADLQGLYGSLDDREMKEQVIFVASQMSERGAVDFLMEVATDEQDKELRERAIFWLGQSNDPRVPEFLLTLIRGNVAR